MKKLYGRPDKTYYLDNYTRFVTMEEVMREYVAEVRVRKRNEQFSYPPDPGLCGGSVVTFDVRK